MPSVRAFALPAMLTAVLALAACGDDDKDTTSSSTTPAATTPAATTPAATTSTATEESSGDGAVSQDEIQKEAQKLNDKWQAKSQELVGKITSDPGSAKKELEPFIKEFGEDYDALLEKVKNSDAPAEVKSAIEQQQKALQSAFDTLKTQLDALP